MPEENVSERTTELKNKLVRQQIRIWDALPPEERSAMFAYAQGYRDFLNQARTERRAITWFIDKADRQGFADITATGSTGTKWYLASRKKMLCMAVVGTKPLTEGMRLIASHVDAPRLDLKPNPLYEDTGLALFKTHYYGGIKKYQWLARPLALCGTVITRHGKEVEIDLGLEPDQPVFTITDLLPHLGKKQMDQKASEFIPAENLNVLVGALPYEDQKTDDRVKLAILEHLHRRYGMVEEDLVTAELQLVPAEPARDVGFDAALIAAYGQDDRLCAYAAFTALLETKEHPYTAVAVFYDKEEIGSEGNTSARSNVVERFILELMYRTGIEPSQRNLHTVFFNARGLSADVAAGLDPTYPDVYEKRNSAKLGYGINIKKYTGSGGKYMASDANAEYAAWVRKLFNDNGVIWQAGELGKVDEGGGGTVAKFLASSGMEIIDCGPPVLGMHSPLELSAKEDLWMCRKAFTVFFGRE